MFIVYISMKTHFACSFFPFFARVKPKAQSNETLNVMWCVLIKKHKKLFKRQSSLWHLLLFMCRLFFASSRSCHLTNRRTMGLKSRSRRAVDDDDVGFLFYTEEKKKKLQRRLFHIAHTELSSRVLYGMMTLFHFDSLWLRRICEMWSRLDIHTLVVECKKRAIKSLTRSGARLGQIIRSAACKHRKTLFLFICWHSARSTSRMSHAKPP